MAKRKKKELTLEEKLEQALVPEDEWPYEVPRNWVWTKIGTLSNLYRGVSYKKNDVNNIQGDNDCLIMRGGNIKEGQIDLFAEDNVYINKSMVSENQLVKKDDIIIVSSTGSTKVIGRAGISDADYLDVSFGAFLTLVRPIDSVCKRYVALYFQSDNYRNRIRKLASGVNINNIRNEYITKTIIPLPPLAEQQRIVDRIENLFAKLDQGKELVQNALDTFETRKAAILHKAFTGKLTAKWRERKGVDFERDWVERKFSELGELERGRSQHRPRNAPELFGGDYPFIQTGDVANANVYIVEHKQTLSEFGLKQSRLFPKGTLCITIAANIGDVAILSYDCCFPDSVVGFTPNGLADSKFIYYFMNIMKDEIEHYAPATAQKNINLKILNDISVKTPQIEEQKEIVLQLDRFFEKEQKAKELYDVIDKIDLMKKAILARAFRGGLGTNDPSEESAVELLKECLK